MFNPYDTSSSSSSEDESESNNNIISSRKRVIRPRINFNFMLVSSFKERFRVAPTTVENILNVIGPLIRHRTSKNHALDSKQQLLIALHFFGSGSQYHCIGDMHGVHASTVCRIINRVSRAIITTMFDRHVCWPTTDVFLVPFGFSLIAGFPRIGGE